MDVEIINRSLFENPSYKTEGSSGLDLIANISEPVRIYPGDRVLIKTGLFMAIPLGYELQVRSRSGLALNKGIVVLNSPGTVDSDYRDEIGVILYNTSKNTFTVEPGDRIAQGVFAKYEKANLINVTVLSETDRKGGFGSTGIK